MNDAVLFCFEVCGLIIVNFLLNVLVIKAVLLYFEKLVIIVFLVLIFGIVFFLRVFKIFDVFYVYVINIFVLFFILLECGYKV